MYFESLNLSVDSVFWGIIQIYPNSVWTTWVMCSLHWHVSSLTSCCSCHHRANVSFMCLHCMEPSIQLSKKVILALISLVTQRLVHMVQNSVTFSEGHAGQYKRVDTTLSLCTVRDGVGRYVLTLHRCKFQLWDVQNTTHHTLPTITSFGLVEVNQQSTKLDVKIFRVYRVCESSTLSLEAD